EWFSDNGRVGLGHRRLTIIDLSEAGHQPMTNEDGTLQLVFNGEIYNYKSLRERLLKKGHIFKSHSDTEVLLHLYEEMGEEMVHELRGMFAFALWDEKIKSLLLARDPYGIKPLYYADDGWTLRAASQVKALLAGGRVERTFDPAGIAGFYLWGDSLGAGAPQPHASIAATLAQAVPASGDAAAAVRAALLESVRYHLVADVPVGLFLSA